MSLKQETKTLLAVIRLRGTVNVNYKIRETLKMLRIERTNYLTLVPKTAAHLGMLKKAKDFITWGEISKETLVYLLKKRGELTGRKKLTDEYLKEHTKYASIEEFAEALYTGEANLNDIPEMKKYFRLHPARKGFKDLKQSFGEGGDLGYRGEAINELIIRMA